MPAREDGVPVDTLREAVSRRVSSGSLRLIAAEIGLAHTTVASFLKGAQPYGRTLAKLRASAAGKRGIEEADCRTGAAAARVEEVGRGTPGMGRPVNASA
jgi:hypothetical protein